MVASELDDLASFVIEMCRERRGPFSKFLLGPNWWKVDEVLPPPLSDDTEPLELAVASVETLQQHTSDFLSVVYETVKIVEDVFRLYFSQDKLFTGSSSEKEDDCKSERDLSDQLLASISSILAMAESRVLTFTGYITTAINVSHKISPHTYPLHYPLHHTSLHTSPYTAPSILPSFKKKSLSPLSPWLTGLFLCFRIRFKR